MVDPVLTWHNDIGRTGQYLNESILTPTTVTQNSFGLLFQYPVQGQVYAQPLAVPGLSGVTNCTGTCNVVFIATQQDMLYAYDADSPTPTLLWSTDLAQNAGGIAVNCANFTMLRACTPNDPIYPYVGVTGTPVIDQAAGILYVVSAISENSNAEDIHEYLHAIDIKTGHELSQFTPEEIGGTVGGLAPPPQNGVCSVSIPHGTNTITFDPVHHLQRAALLLLPVNGQNVVYVAFAPVIAQGDASGEFENGWIFGYKYVTGTGHFSRVATFNTTPYGTGGGVWGSGGGLAAEIRSDGSKYIYATTGNGTFDANNPGQSDYGDSLLKLRVNINNGALTVADYFTPSDQGTRCLDDDDLASGGVMVFPEAFFPDQNGNLVNLVVGGDKKSKLFVANRDNLGGYHSTDSILEEIILPSSPPPNSNPKYYSTPAYWKYTENGATKRALYYSVQYASAFPPVPIDMYTLQTNYSVVGPIPNVASHSTQNGFCPHGATPSISANGMSGGILWAIQRVNADPGDCLAPDPNNSNWQKPMILHAYDATNIHNNELYNSSGVTAIKGFATKFLPPTVFNGKVYVGTLGSDLDWSGTHGEVDVFGLCGNPPKCQ